MIVGLARPKEGKEAKAIMADKVNALLNMAATVSKPSISRIIGTCQCRRSSSRPYTYGGILHEVLLCSSVVVVERALVRTLQVGQLHVFVHLPEGQLFLSACRSFGILYSQIAVSTSELSRCQIYIPL